MVEARKDTTVLIHPLTDHRRILPVEKRGELLEAADNFLLVISYNPGYQSVLKDLKHSTRQRFVAIEFDYPPKEVEQEVIAHESGCSMEVAKDLAKLGEKVRNLREHGLQEGASTRLLIYAGRLIKKGIAPRRACQVSVVWAPHRRRRSPAQRRRSGQQYLRVVRATSTLTMLDTSTDTFPQEVARLLSNRDAARVSADGRMPAAVLILLMEKEGRFHIILNVRTQQVEHHKGEISFPGGMHEDSDPDLRTTCSPGDVGGDGYKAGGRDHPGRTGRLRDSQRIRDLPFRRGIPHTRMTTTQARLRSPRCWRRP